jgi:hypothetical protein
LQGSAPDDAYPDSLLKKCFGCEACDICDRESPPRSFRSPLLLGRASFGARGRACRRADVFDFLSVTKDRPMKLSQRFIPVVAFTLCTAIAAPVPCQEEGCRASAILSLDASPPPADGREFRIAQGEDFEFDLIARLETHFEGRWGVQGFSLSVAHDGDVLEITGATQEGTDTAEVFPWNLVFERVETVENETGTGFVCALVLSLTNPVTFPPEGVFSLARASYRVLPAFGAAGEILTTIEYRDGLRGSGQPVNNTLTWNGKSVDPCTIPFSVHLVPVLAELFLRGDSDGDGTLDISDAVATVGYLFLGAQAPRCLDAADANDDGQLDLTDPIFCLDFLFRGGGPPPEPFPLVGSDPTEDEIPCSPPED